MNNKTSFCKCYRGIFVVFLFYVILWYMPHIYMYLISSVGQGGSLIEGLFQIVLNPSHLFVQLQWNLAESWIGKLSNKMMIVLQLGVRFVITWVIFNELTSRHHFECQDTKIPITKIRSMFETIFPSIQMHIWFVDIFKNWIIGIAADILTQYTITWVQIAPPKMHLWKFLKRSHLFLILIARPTDDDHGPAVLLRVGETGERVN